ncbi:MAG: hypothetical protein ABI823_07625 [Bryobacteraceae bacterium]
MPCYVSSTNNRFYVGLEESFGAVGGVTEKNRIPAVKLEARQTPAIHSRRDKTGSRTFAGLPAGVRRNTDFALETFLTAWTDPAFPPCHGPLFQAAMGGTPKVFAGAVVQFASGTQLTFGSAHGLTPGQAVTFGGEMRFVVAVSGPQDCTINAPFSAVLSGATLGPTVTYTLATGLPSASIFDYWDPETAVQRVLSGAAVDRMRIRVNGDFHEFRFSGPARDLLDSASFTAGEGALTQFPVEPAQVGFDYTIVPGHIGQVWIGTGPTQFYSLTSAEIELKNNIETRNREFGTDLPRCLSAGDREVTVNFSLFEQQDAATRELYQAARQRSPLPVMFQLGQQAGQLFGVHMNGVIPEVPEYDDTDSRLEWKFRGSRAQGFLNDELYVAFG